MKQCLSQLEVNYRYRFVRSGSFTIMLTPGCVSLATFTFTPSLPPPCRPLTVVDKMIGSLGYFTEIDEVVLDSKNATMSLTTSFQTSQSFLK